METNEQNTKEELKEEKIVADETPQEEVTEETTTELSNEEKLQQEVERLNDQVYRLSAEISNIQKRNAKERAIASPSESEDAQNLKKGIEMVYESFLYALKEEGIEEIDALDQPFDPTLHHAVQTVPVEEGQEADKVVQVFQKGYKLKDRVLRPAMVIVSQ